VSVRARVSEHDRRLMRRAHAARAPHRDRALRTITTTANFSGLWVGLSALMVLLGGERGRRAAGGGLLAVSIAATVANGPAKWLTRRERPSEHPTLIDLPKTTSFPSGHSASAAAFATGACAQSPALGPLLVPLAGSVAYSRVHMGVHYPSDVAAGVALGVASGALATRLLGARSRPYPASRTRSARRRSRGR
jgi:membrane-associated phospholipid phosphatase